MSEACVPTPRPPLDKGGKGTWDHPIAQQNHSLRDQLSNPVNTNFSPRRARPPRIVQRYLGDGEPAPAFRGTRPAEGLADRGQSFEGRQQLGAVVGEATAGHRQYAPKAWRSSLRASCSSCQRLRCAAACDGVAQATLDGGQPVVGVGQVRVELQGPAIMRRGGGPVAGAFPGLAAEDPEIGLGLRNGGHPGQDRVEGIPSRPATGAWSGSRARRGGPRAGHPGSLACRGGPRSAGPAPARRWPGARRASQSAGSAAT